MRDLRIERVADLTAALSIRAEVFVAEQGVSPADEVDGDDPVCLHWLATDATGPVATLRIRLRDGSAKIQRVAVLRRARGTGIGAVLMRHVMAELTADGIRTFVLGAQLPALGFYERLGFTAHGPVYDDAGIPHRDMAHGV